MQSIVKNDSLACLLRTQEISPNIRIVPDTNLMKILELAENNHFIDLVYIHRAELYIKDKSTLVNLIKFAKLALILSESSFSGVKIIERVDKLTLFIGQSNSRGVFGNFWEIKKKIVLTELGKKISDLEKHGITSNRIIMKSRDFAFLTETNVTELGQRPFMGIEEITLSWELLEKSEDISLTEISKLLNIISNNKRRLNMNKIGEKGLRILENIYDLDIFSILKFWIEKEKEFTTDKLINMLVHKIFDPAQLLLKKNPKEVLGPLSVYTVGPVFRIFINYKSVTSGAAVMVAIKNLLYAKNILFGKIRINFFMENKKSLEIEEGLKSLDDDNFLPEIRNVVNSGFFNKIEITKIG